MTGRSQALCKALWLQRLISNNTLFPQRALIVLGRSTVNNDTTRMKDSMCETMVCLVEKLSFVQARVRVLPALSSLLTTHQYILNRVSLNRNTHNTRFYMGPLMKNNCNQNLTHISPGRNGSVCANSVLRLYRTQPLQTTGINREHHGKGFVELEARGILGSS